MNLITKQILICLSPLTVKDHNEKNINLALKCIDGIEIENVGFLDRLESKRCEKEASDYESRYCGGENSDCYDKQYDRCQESYKGHTIVLIMDHVTDFLKELFKNRNSREECDRYCDDRRQSRDAERFQRQAREVDRNLSRDHHRGD
ncbi:MAG: hypothetical protein OQJ93_09430 [Ignavibacteriaceae bacterium]|jgi:hypothetical protein|nr:hypothetical protein [Ignavibacteriaceae bacterium]